MRLTWGQTKAIERLSELEAKAQVAMKAGDMNEVRDIRRTLVADLRDFTKGDLLLFMVAQQEEIERLRRFAPENHKRP